MIAARLSEDPKSACCCSRPAARPRAPTRSASPRRSRSLFKTRWDWNYSTTEQKQLHGRRAYWPRMKALGGCSSMNAMIYIRGNRVDYDSWRDQYGATGWGFDDVLPYFVKSEGNTRLGGPLHGQSGPLHVEDRVYTHGSVTRSSTARSARGSSRPTTSTASRRRVPAVPGDLQEGPALVDVRGLPQAGAVAPNLTITTGALAARIELEGERATGVTFRQSGREHTVVREPRGDPLRRGDQQPAAADAVRHRPRAPPARGRHRRAGRPRRRRRQPPGPPGRAAPLGHAGHAPTSASSTT